VTVVRCTQGYIFGGYASTAWDSSGNYKSATSSFLFTLSNPHNINPIKFPLTQNTGKYDINGNPSYGPVFGAGNDMLITNNCHVNNCSFRFPNSYSDTTGRGGNVFTGASNFLVSDIEVFLVK
jgi:hypothetical protein